MDRNFLPKMLFVLLFCSVFGIAMGQTSTNTVDYKVTYDPVLQKYTTWVVPNYATPNIYNSGSTEKGATAQVTLKVPTGFTLSQITDVNGVWDKGPLKLGPNQQSQFIGQGLDASKSYYVIGKGASETDYGVFTAGVAIPLFTFTGNGCFGAIEVIQKTDPFVTVSDNLLSLNASPSFYSRSGQASGGNQDPLEQFRASVGFPANCVDAINDTFSAFSGVPTPQSVLFNDGYNGSTPTVANVNVSVSTPPTNGVATVNPDGTIAYKANPGFVGTDTYVYQICDKANPTVCDVATITISVTCPTIALPTITSPVTYCQGVVSSPLTATPASGATLLWYTTASGGSGAATAPTPSTATAGTIAYFVSSNISGCESARAKIDVVTIAAPSVPSAISPVTYCQGATATTLSATPASGGSLLWYTAATGGTGTTTAPTPSTTTAGTTSYYVASLLGSCESLTRTEIVVVINAAPSLPIASTPVTYCQGSTASALTATPASGGSLLWYTTATGGTGTTTAPIPSTTIASTTSYYVSSVLGSCESLTRTKINIIVNSAPTVPSVSSPITYCQGTTASALTATSAFGSSLLWYTTATGGTGTITAPTPSTATAGTISYYVSSKDNNNACESLTRAKIDVITNATPSAAIATSPVTYCQSATASQLSATPASGATLLWYTSAIGSTGSTTAPTPSTSAVGITSYYVVSVLGNCESLTRTKIDVVVNATPSAPVSTSPITYCQGATANILTATPIGSSTLLWFSTATGGTGSTTAPTPSTATAGTTSYYVGSNLGSCQSLTRTKIDVIINSAPTTPSVNSPITYCQIAVASALTASSGFGSSLLWYTTATGGVGSSVAPTPSTTTAGTTSYYVTSRDNNNACESLIRAKIDVVVNATPAAPTATSPVNYCKGTTATALTATTATGATLYWYTAATGGTGTATSPTPSTATVGTTSYYVGSLLGTCESLARTKIDVTVASCKIIYAYNDNNITPINSTVNGNVLTNDDLNNGTTALVVSTTPVAQPLHGTVTLNANGGYAYVPTLNYVGNDSFKYKVCDFSTPNICDSATVFIEVYAVVNPSINNKPIALDDIQTTTKNTPVVASVMPGSKDPDVGQVLTTTIQTPPTHGSVTLAPNGTFTYTPSTDYVGKDTFTYTLCDNGSPILCDQATITVTVKDTPPVGTNLPPLTNDDYIIAPNGLPVLGNAIQNDSDPENGIWSINTTPITNPLHGSVVINSNGTYTYTPTAGYVGSDSFVYEICDNGTPKACAKGTVYIEVLSTKVALQPKAYLQGALFGVTGSTLMRDDLHTKGLLPTTSPYPAMGLTELTPTGSVAASVLAITGNDAIVDWVFVELRDGSNSQKVLDSRSALIQRDGDIVDTDGTSALMFGAVQPGNYYVAIKHRSHLGVISKTSLPLNTIAYSIDFRLATTPTYTLTTNIVDVAQVAVEQGVALWAGNALFDNKVIYQGTSNDVNAVYQQVISSTSNIFVSPYYKLKGYYTGDINMNGETVFQGTGNDIEYIYQNVIKNHTGNILKQNFFIIKEQLP